MLWPWNIFNRKTVEEQFYDTFVKHDTGAYITPDALVLKNKPEHLILIYDNMMFKRSEWPILECMVIDTPEDGKCLGPGMALIAVEAYHNKNTNEVIALPSHNGVRPEWSTRKGPYGANIRGTLHKVSPETILELDKIYGNNVYYIRQEVAVEKWRIKQGTRPYIEYAWIYIGRPEHWLIDGGFEWEPLKINRRNPFTEEPHYWYQSRR